MVTVYIYVYNITHCVRVYESYFSELHSEQNSTLARFTSGGVEDHISLQVESIAKHSVQDTTSYIWPLSTYTDHFPT